MVFRVFRGYNCSQLIVRWIRRIQRKWKRNDESIPGLWKFLQSRPTRDDGPNDDDASQHGSNGGDDATHGRGQS